MAKIVFPYQIKYLGKYFPANAPFKANDEDVKNLISDGGKLLEQSPKLAKTQNKEKPIRKRG